MSSARACPSCGSGNFPNATHCWLCQYPVGTAAPAAAAQQVVQVAAPSAFSGLGWMLGFVLSLFLMTAIGFELAILWPGLLIPYAVVFVPVVAVAGRIAYVQRFDFWKSEKSPAASAAGTATAPAQPALDQRGDPIARSAIADESSGVAGQILSAVAIGMTSLIVVVGLLVLLAVAAFVFMLAICFAFIAMEGY